MIAHSVILVSVDWEIVMDPWTKHDRVPPNVNDAHNQDCWKIFIIIGPAGHRIVNIFLVFYILMLDFSKDFTR